MQISAMRVHASSKKSASIRSWPISDRSSKVWGVLTLCFSKRPGLTVLVDGNLSGYHKKKYVCKVGSVSARPAHLGV